jgi:hypothetical protein
MRLLHREADREPSPRPALPDDNGDDNDDNRRHTIPTVGHRSPTLMGRRACTAVDYGSEGWGFESLRLRQAKTQVITSMTWVFRC